MLGTWVVHNWGSPWHGKNGGQEFHSTPCKGQGALGGLTQLQMFKYI